MFENTHSKMRAEKEKRAEYDQVNNEYEGFGDGTESSLESFSAKKGLRWVPAVEKQDRMCRTVCWVLFPG